jgi:hypothetical protein
VARTRNGGERGRGQHAAQHHTQRGRVGKHSIVPFPKSSRSKVEKPVYSVDKRYVKYPPEDSA